MTYSFCGVSQVSLYPGILRYPAISNYIFEFFYYSLRICNCLCGFVDGIIEIGSIIAYQSSFDDRCLMVSVFIIVHLCCTVFIQFESLFLFMFSGCCFLTLISAFIVLLKLLSIFFQYFVINLFFLQPLFHQFITPSILYLYFQSFPTISSFSQVPSK